MSKSDQTYLDQNARLAIYAEGEFGKGRSKTAEGVIRYGRNPVAAVIDSTAKGKTVNDVITGIKSHAPIVGSVDEAVSYKPDALLLGTAWTGGALPKQWRGDIMTALEQGMDVVNGLHDFLEDDSEISALAKRLNRKLYDVRRPPEDLPVAKGLAADVHGFTVLTVGTDCSVGKMTVALEIEKVAVARGFKSKFIATGQTGIMICGEGIAIDRVIGDFMAGATEKLVLEADAAKPDFIFVEGQGSLAHPGFSGVTLALLHGAAPPCMILCHKSSRSNINETRYPQPEMSKLIQVYEMMASYIRESKIVGVALNTVGFDDAQSRELIEEAKKLTGLPCTDPVRFGGEPLFEAIHAFKEAKERK